MQHQLKGLSHSLHIMFCSLCLLRRSPPDATGPYDESELLERMRLEDEALQSLFVEHTA